MAAAGTLGVPVESGGFGCSGSPAPDGAEKNIPLEDMPFLLMSNLRNTPKILLDEYVTEPLWEKVRIPAFGHSWRMACS